MTLKISHSLRGNKFLSKGYINNLLANFAPLYVATFKDKKIMAVQVCKQDMRGCLSISLFDDRGCVPHQRHFLSQSECIAFIQGFLFCARG